MKTVFKRIDPLRLFALALLGLPTLAVFGLGILWLWQTGNLLYWAVVMAVFGALGYGLQYWLAQRDRKLLDEIATEPNPDWSPSAEAVWQEVEKLAATCDPKDWPIEEASWILELGRRTLDTVAQSYHPQSEKPFLEINVPHALLIIEQASRDLRKEVTENIPLSDRLTIGDLLRMHRWKTKAEQIYNVYRAGRVLVNPVNALFGEIWRHLRERSFGVAQGELHRWFLRTYVRKVGYYAIDLYSGRQPVIEDAIQPAASQTAESQTDLGKAERAAAVPEEPLRILVLGRTNAGKSSLINALFGKLTTATDILPDTTRAITPFVLQREGLTRALIFDTPGCDSTRYSEKQMHTAALETDLILWVSPANRPDRQAERQCLDALRIFQTTQLNRRPPPLLIVMSHIDLLRPASAWQPPYNLSDLQDNSKAASIRAALQAVATDLAVPVERVIPVCLKEGKVYNVNDALWSAILNFQDEALRIRLLRCLDAKKRAEDWVLLRRQLISTGRFLWNLPDKLGKRAGE